MAFTKINDTDSLNKNYYSDEESDDGFNSLIIRKRNGFRVKKSTFKVNGNYHFKWGETELGHHHLRLSATQTCFFVLFIFLIFAILLFCYIYHGGCTESLLIATVFGSSVTIFTWMITYHDSKRPGIFPPTPLSPRQIREESGHTFHFNYIVAILNGIICFTIAMYKQMGASIYDKK